MVGGDDWSSGSWPRCFMAVRSSNTQPQSGIFLWSERKNTMSSSASTDRLIVLAAFTLADLIRVCVHFHCTSKIRPVCPSFWNGLPRDFKSLGSRLVLQRLQVPVWSLRVYTGEIVWVCHIFTNAWFFLPRVLGQIASRHLAEPWFQSG